MSKTCQQKTKQGREDTFSRSPNDFSGEGAFEWIYTEHQMPMIAEGIDFDTTAREWRCKWSADNDKASLVEARKAIDSIPIAL
jgi:hypothetical protein